MEAATAHGNDLLTRDGALPVTPLAGRGTAAPGRDAIDGTVECACCRRHPLLGEQVIRHAGRKGEGWVCERCEADGRGDRIGAVLGRARIRSLGGAMNVRRIA